MHEEFSRYDNEPFNEKLLKNSTFLQSDFQIRMWGNPHARIAVGQQATQTEN